MFHKISFFLHKQAYNALNKTTIFAWTRVLDTEIRSIAFEIVATAEKTSTPTSVANVTLRRMPRCACGSISIQSIRLVHRHYCVSCAEVKTQKRDIYSTYVWTYGGLLSLFGFSPLLVKLAVIVQNIQRIFKKKMQETFAFELPFFEEKYSNVSYLLSM